MMKKRRFTRYSLMTLWCVLVMSRAAVSETIHYSYDPLHRLRSVAYEQGMTEEYTYDAVGNRLRRLIRESPSGFAYLLWIHSDATQAPTPPTPILPLLIVKKAGSGRGTILAGGQECGPGCEEMLLPYGTHIPETLQVVPDAASVFVRWETEQGIPIETISSDQSGDTLIAVFEKRY